MNTRFREDIQGLRAIAVLSVMVFHYNPELLPGGFVGVDVFFVISGFLITKIILSVKEQKSKGFFYILSNFYLSRACRIIPAYIFLLFIVSIASGVLFSVKDYYFFNKSLEAALWFSSNFYFSDFFDYFSTDSSEWPLLHTWSLAVEIQFYLIFPFLLLLVSKRYLVFLLVIVLCFCIVYAEVYLQDGRYQEIYYSFFGRIPEFLLGSLLAIKTDYIDQVLSERVERLLGLLGGFFLLCSILLIKGSHGFPGVFSLAPVIGTVLVMNNSFYFRWILCSKLMIVIGALSYSLYLWHWPVLSFIRYFTGDIEIGALWSFVFIILAFFFSIISYFFIEKKFSKEFFKKSIAVNLMNRKVFSCVVFFVLFMISSPLGKAINAELSPPELPQEYTRYADPDLICHGKIIDECERGKKSSSVSFLVIGNSHAAMLNEFFHVLGNDLGFKAKVVTASSCVTITGFDYERIPYKAQAPCLSQIAQVEKFIPDYKYIFIAASWDGQVSSIQFMEALNDFIDSYPNKMFFLLSQVPRFKYSPLRKIRWEHIGIPVNKLPIDKKYELANSLVASLVEDKENAQFLDIGGLNLLRNGAASNGKPLYFDEHHLNEFGAIAYAKTAKKYFEEIIQNFDG